MPKARQSAAMARQDKPRSWKDKQTKGTRRPWQGKARHGHRKASKQEASEGRGKASQDTAMARQGKPRLGQGKATIISIMGHFPFVFISVLPHGSPLMPPYCQCSSQSHLNCTFSKLRWSVLVRQWPPASLLCNCLRQENIIIFMGSALTTRRGCGRGNIAKCPNDLCN